MLHLAPDKSKLHSDQSAQSVKECMEEYEINNKSLNEILDQICKDTELYPYVKSISPSMTV